MSIVDDFPPHEWHGEGACAGWMADYKAYAAEKGITAMIVTLSNPRHVDVSADHAYVVVPVGYTLKKHGSVIKKTNSIVTVALRRGAAGWYIVGWAWADG
jgi:hypothetical protein